MRIIDPLLAELEQESETTRRVLQAVPGHKLDWKPHERSLSLGELAAHVAQLPGSMAGILGGDAFDFDDRSGNPPAPATQEELLASLEDSLAEGRAFLDELDDARATGLWSLVKGGQELFQLPRVAALRSFLLNHLYHHRGQLSVYLRLLDQHVPSVYGPTADENPFG